MCEIEAIALKENHKPVILFTLSMSRPSCGNVTTNSGAGLVEIL